MASVTKEQVFAIINAFPKDCSALDVARELNYGKEVTDPTYAIVEDIEKELKSLLKNDNIKPGTVKNTYLSIDLWIKSLEKLYNISIVTDEDKQDPWRHLPFYVQKIALQSMNCLPQVMEAMEEIYYLTTEYVSPEYVHNYIRAKHPTGVRWGLDNQFQEKITETALSTLNRNELMFINGKYKYSFLDMKSGPSSLNAPRDDKLYRLRDKYFEQYKLKKESTDNPALVNQVENQKKEISILKEKLALTTELLKQVRQEAVSLVNESTPRLQRIQNWIDWLNTNGI